MKEFVKCRGDVANRNIVNCPLHSSCLRYTVKSIGFEQKFMITPIKEINETCKMYIENDKRN